MYFITTIDSNDFDMRCVGYVETFEKAEEIVLNNICDIWETCYDYVVIEHISKGLYQYDFHPSWYKWNHVTKYYEKIQKAPKQFKNTMGFAFG